MNDFDLNVLHLQFTLQAESPIHLGPQAGGQIRGALWAALRQFACTDPAVYKSSDHSRYCPMCRLVALETDEGTRGMNPPRPFAVRPPLAVHPGQDRLYDRGECFTIGISLFGDARDLVGYVCQAMYRMGQLGVGYGRGRFRFQQVQAVNLLTSEVQDLLASPTTLLAPSLMMNSDHVHQKVMAMNPERVRLRFVTPTLLKADHRVQDYPAFPVLIGRLLERCQSLEKFYTETEQPIELWRERHLSLTAAAETITAMHGTSWMRVESGSRRTGEMTAIGGFVGDVSYSGDLAPFLEWLVWGSLLHIGKNVVKGSGWYEIVS